MDTVLILLISKAVQNAMAGSDNSLLGGIIAALTLLVMSYFFTLILSRSRKAEHLFEGTPTLLVHNGKVIHKHLQQERITEDELERAVREHGVENIRHVKNAVMEADGTISVIPIDGVEKHIDTFRHHRMKYQQRWTL